MFSVHSSTVNPHTHYARLQRVFSISDVHLEGVANEQSTWSVTSPISQSVRLVNADEGENKAIGTVVQDTRALRSTTFANKTINELSDMYNSHDADVNTDVNADAAGEADGRANTMAPARTVSLNSENLVHHHRDVSEPSVSRSQSYSQADASRLAPGIGSMKQALLQSPDLTSHSRSAVMSSRQRDHQQQNSKVTSSKAYKPTTTAATAPSRRQLHVDSPSVSGNSRKGSKQRPSQPQQISHRQNPSQDSVSGTRIDDATAIATAINIPQDELPQVDTLGSAEARGVV